jgi:hypothetical protein
LQFSVCYNLFFIICLLKFASIIVIFLSLAMCLMYKSDSSSSDHDGLYCDDDDESYSDDDEWLVKSMGLI